MDRIFSRIILGVALVFCAACSAVESTGEAVSGVGQAVGDAGSAVGRGVGDAVGATGEAIESGSERTRRRGY